MMSQYSTYTSLVPRPSITADVLAVIEGLENEAILHYELEE